MRQWGGRGGEKRLGWREISSLQLGNIETIGFNRRTIETIGSNRFNSFQYKELTREKSSKSVIVKNVKHGRH